MWIVRLALRRPYTFVVAALVLLPDHEFRQIRDRIEQRVCELIGQLGDAAKGTRSEQLGERAPSPQALD